MITCPKCSKDNQDHYKFCLGCGAELPRDAAPKPFAPQTPAHGVKGAPAAPAPVPVPAPVAAPAPAPVAAPAPAPVAVPAPSAAPPAPVTPNQAPPANNQKRTDQQGLQNLINSTAGASANPPPNPPANAAPAPGSTQQNQPRR